MSLCLCRREMLRHHHLCTHPCSHGGHEGEHMQEELQQCRRRARLSQIRFIFLISFCSFSVLHLLSSTSAIWPLLCNGIGDLLQIPNISSSSPSLDNVGIGPCSSSPDAICCDRTAFRTDICFLRGGDIRTHSPTNSILVSSTNATPTPPQTIRPYPRKWETAIMATIPSLHIVPTGPSGLLFRCDVRHLVPALVFSAGGYTGNVYHEFNDGILPLYITSQHFNKQVVLVVVEYRNWWFTKYRDVLSRLSDYPPVDFTNDTRTHCFPAAVVGLRAHGDLIVDPALMPPHNKSIAHFRQLLDEAYRPRIRSLEQERDMSPQPQATEEKQQQQQLKLVVVSRNGSRAIENEGELVGLAEEVGFRVAVLRPEPTMELAKIYWELNGSDAMVGVHGAAMTHLLFMRAGAVFIQIVPLGTQWAAQTFYGEPAVKMGLWYSAYSIHPEESSLSKVYERNDPVLRKPEAVTAKGWQATKRVYLDDQNVRLDVDRFRRRLLRAHRYLVWKRAVGGY